MTVARRKTDRKSSSRRSSSCFLLPPSLRLVHSQNLVSSGKLPEVSFPAKIRGKQSHCKTLSSPPMVDGGADDSQPRLLSPASNCYLVL